MLFSSCKTTDNIRDILSELQEDTIIFVDVDDTIITPQSKLFRWSSPYRYLIDDLKKNRDLYPNYNDIISHWRSNRKTMLISDEWPNFLQNLQRRFKVYALTKMDSGQIGSIPSMEKWRHNELIGKGIHFTPHFQNVTEAQLIGDDPHKNPASFYEGIFITGAYPKSAIIQNYLKENRPGHIVFIDDRPEYLQDVRQECQQHNIPFTGVHFKGMELLEGTPDSKVAEFQKHSLFEKCHWYEDEEASQLLKVTTDR